MSTRSALFSVAFTALISKGLAGYNLTKTYTSSNFFSEFDFFTDADPTQGTVEYVDFATANSSGLVGTADFGNFTDLIYLGVDSKTVLSNGAGRQSVRLSSNDTFNHGLFLFEVVNSPSGVCGTWPALWLLGNAPAGQSGTWPDFGEIDIMEGVNLNDANQMTLHTTSGCNIAGSSGFSGNLLTTDCNVDNSSQPTNAGCGIQSRDQQTFGSVFNEDSGGVYATEWTSSYIRIWFFPRDNIPSDIQAGNPDTQSWGTPQANFQGNCNIDTHFQNMQILIDTTFCGDWAGQTWNTSSCASKAPTCEQFVQENPEAFTDAYWTFESIKVYQSS